MTKRQVEALQRFQDHADRMALIGNFDGWMQPNPVKVNLNSVYGLVEKGLLEQRSFEPTFAPTWRITDEGRYALATHKENQA